ncbi:MAG: epoxyqueuosine reductase [Bacillota bacterium]
METNPSRWIEAYVKQKIWLAADSLQTKFREPLLGVADANDPLFDRLKEVVAEDHLLPKDLLADAQSVLVFFLPFASGLMQENRSGRMASREWAVAYIEANTLINTLCGEIEGELRKKGIEAAFQPATHNFDPVSLRSFWSHKHAAFIAGLGTFGLHHMLITPAGCGGRFGSMIFNAKLEVTPRPQVEYCLYRRGKSCRVCLDRCPTGALSVSGIDKQVCYAHLLDVDLYYPDLATCDVCGKCATGPCAAGIPGLNQA